MIMSIQIYFCGNGCAGSLTGGVLSGEIGCGGISGVGSNSGGITSGGCSWGGITSGGIGVGGVVSEREILYIIAFQ